MENHEKLVKNISAALLAGFIGLWVGGLIGYEGAKLFGVVEDERLFVLIGALIFGVGGLMAETRLQQKGI